MDLNFFEFTKLSFDNLNRHIRLADNKAKFLLSLDLAVISGLSAFAFKFFPLISKSQNFLCITIIFSIAIISLMSSLFYTVLIITPKNNPKNNPSKMLYWGQIAKIKIEDLQNKYWQTSNEEKMKELINQIYFYSLTATEKYNRVKFALISLSVSILATIITVLISIASI